MSIKKTLQTSGVTLLGAVSLLLVGALLFLSVWALLPDGTGETHSYGMPSLPAKAGRAELYPWDRMTTPWEEGADTLDDDDLYTLLNPLFTPYFSSYWYIENRSNGEFLCDRSQAMFGFRDLYLRVRTNLTLIVDMDGQEVATSPIEELRFSLAFRDWYDSTEVCYLSLEPPPREEASPAAEEAGMNALYEWIKERDLNLDSGSPFAAFLWRFVDFCVMLDCDYVAYNTAFILFETGGCELTPEGHTVYCTFTGREGVMTLLYDPVYQAVYGISIQRYN